MTRKKKPAGQNADPAPDAMSAGTVAELMGWTISQLFQQIRNGTIPCPPVRGCWLAFPITYVLWLKEQGLSIPGTHPGFPPGYSPSRELDNWVRADDGKPVRYVRKSAKTRAPKSPKPEGML